jgi:hypothetical protein
MRTLVFLGSFLFGLFLMTSHASADVYDANWELQRQLGFNEHEKQDAQFEQARQSGADDMKKSRAEWEKKRLDSIHDYKVWKQNQGKTPDENSPEYREDQQERQAARWAREKDREFYQQRDQRYHQELEKIHPLKECREFELCDVQLGDKQFEEKRIPQKDRFLYGHKPAYLTESQNMAKSGSVSFSGSSGGTEFSPSVPQPIPPAAPEFYEPDVPPPPPPPMPEGGYDNSNDQVPPPIFDDPGY